MSESKSAAVPVAEMLEHFDLFDPDHQDRRWEVFKYARESQCPIIKTDADKGYFVITNYDDLREIANDPETFSSVEPALRGVPVRLPPVSEDPPLHGEFRKLLNPFFSRAYLLRYEQEMRGAARELLDELVPAGRMEFMNDFALPYTAASLARVILDEKDSDRIARARAVAVRISAENTPEAWIELSQVASEFMADRKASGLDGEDLLSAIVNGQVEGRPLTLEEQVGICTTLFSGGWTRSGPRSATSPGTWPRTPRSKRASLIPLGSPATSTSSYASSRRLRFWLGRSRATPRSMAAR